MFLEKLAQESDRSFAPPGFSVGEIVGMGGMGVVYELLPDKKTKQNNPQVMKIVHPRLTTFLEAEVQLKHEAEIEMELANLTCVVRTLKYGLHSKGHGYKIMQLMEGYSLKAWLRQNPTRIQPLEISRHTQFRRLFLNLARNFEEVGIKMRLLKIMPIFKLLQEALGQVHQQGIVHGDLKPNNVFLNKTGDGLRLFDFGLAHRTRDRERPFKTPFRAYTPLYASPAVLKGKLPDLEDDCYSLAAIFWEMLFGKDSLRVGHLPFKLKNFPEILEILKPLL